MGKIIKIDGKKKGNQNTNMYKEKMEKIIKCYTVESGKGRKEYCIADAIQIADEILDIYSKESFAATPIVRIIKDFGFLIYNSDLDKLNENGVSGIIEVNGQTKDIYSNDKIIVTNCNDPNEHQRFVAAHELGHYIMHCLGDSKYLDKNILFKETYVYNSHQDKKEKCADQFAAQLLMPKKKFVYRYAKAVQDFNGERERVIKYLSDYFQVKKESVEKRVKEILLEECYEWG
jgi:Zn-dependent peptidase ImmA (M78 family)